MPDAQDHSVHVDAWLGQTAKDLSAEQLLRLFEQAMGALWNRTHLALGEVTLMAVMDRVLLNASERFPPFESLKVEATGIDFRWIRQESQVLNDRALREGIRFVVLEFLTVIGNLTGEILTPALHAELSKVTTRDLQARKAEGKA